MRIAVIGAGIFGCTTAVELARAGHTVDLYERHRDILMGASRANQGRLHRGYHYPRDPHAGQLAAHADRFAVRFPQAVVASNRHYYAIAEGSVTSAEAYVDFCRTNGLPFRRHVPPTVRRDNVTECLAVPESLVDLAALRLILRRELRQAGVRLHTGCTPGRLDVDLTVNATYGQPSARPLRYEVCETVLVRLGGHYAGHSIVVMDGPFVSLDPVPGTDLHALYHVAHTVHHASVGYTPEIPDRLASLVDRGVVRTRWSRVEVMVGAAQQFLRGFFAPEYHGSMFTVRAVLPDVDATDARPTLVEADGDTVTILSGKIVTAPWAATAVLAQVGVLTRPAVTV